MIVSKHAAERLTERGITEADCEAVLRLSGNPDAGNNGNLVYRGPVRGRQLTVVVSADGSVLVSAYWGS